MNDGAHMYTKWLSELYIAWDIVMRAEHHQLGRSDARPSGQGCADLMSWRSAKGSVQLRRTATWMSLVPARRSLEFVVV